VISCTILTQTAQEMRNYGSDAATTVNILRKAQTIVMRNIRMRTSHVETIDAVCAVLRQEGVNVPGVARCKSLMLTHTTKGHPVYTHVTKQIKRLWYHILSGEKYDLGMPEATQCIVPLATASAIIFGRIVRCSIMVHGDTYKQLTGLV